MIAKNEIGHGSFGELDLVSGDPPEAFDAVTRLAMGLFGADVALVSIVQEELDRQFFLSQQGLPEPWKSLRQTPLSHSFCQHVKKSGAPLVVADARLDPLLRDNLAIAELGVVAYLGTPITNPEGRPLGALCVINQSPREWTEQDLAMLEDLATCVKDEIMLRAVMQSNKKALKKSKRYSAMRESVSLAFMAPDLTVEQRFDALLKAACKVFDATSGRIVRADCGRFTTIFESDAKGQIRVKERRAMADALTKQVMRECRHVHYDDLSRPEVSARLHLPPDAQGCYAGTPLLVGGIVFGAVEFFGTATRPATWTEEELSMLSMVSMLAMAYLDAFGQIETLKQTQGAVMSPSVQDQPARLVLDGS